jgi:hypothetical protein
MFKAIFASLIGGGPWEWLALALGVMVLFGGTFAAGAAWQSSRDMKVVASIAPTAIKAQHDQDVKQHKAATAANAIIVAHDADADKKLDAVLARLAQIKPDKNCNLPSDAVKALNDAGRVE